MKKNLVLVLMVTFFSLGQLALANGLKDGSYSCTDLKTGSVGVDDISVINDSDALHIDMEEVRLKISKDKCVVLNFIELRAKCEKNKIEVERSLGKAGSFHKVSWVQNGNDIIATETYSSDKGINVTDQLKCSLEK